MDQTKDRSDETSAFKPEQLDRHEDASQAPEGMLIRDEARGRSHRVAVSYLRGTRRPRITVERQSGRVQTVYADGVPVVVIATAKPIGIAPEDVVLVER